MISLLRCDCCWQRSNLVFYGLHGVIDSFVESEQLLNETTTKHISEETGNDGNE